MLIAMIEMTIKYNGLQPENDLSSPSQLVPFVAGVTNSIDSVLYLVRPYKKRRPEVAPTPKSSSASSLPPIRPEDQERHDPEGNSIHTCQRCKGKIGRSNWMRARVHTQTCSSGLLGDGGSFGDFWKRNKSRLCQKYSKGHIMATRQPNIV